MREWSRRSLALDGRGLAALRVGLGALLTWEFCARLASASTWLSDAGLVPREMARPLAPLVSRSVSNGPSLPRFV